MDEIPGEDELDEQEEQSQEEQEQHGQKGQLPTQEPQSDYVSSSDRLLVKKLSFIEASRCLNTLGKDESGVKIAYLKLSALDMQLTDISCIVNFKHLHFVDVSNNFLRLEALQVLTELPYLLYIKVEGNIVESAGLKPMPFLQVLLLNRNRIKETIDISQPLLNCLEIGENRISSINFDSSLVNNLKELSLHGNNLTELSGQYPQSLESLYLNRNKISKISFTAPILRNLKRLNLRENNIRKLDGFTEALVNLSYLNLRNNKINKVRQFRKLKSLPNLRSLIIMGNPVCFAKGSMDEEEEEDEEIKEDEDSSEEDMLPKDTLRLSVLAILPNLRRIDKEYVSDEEIKESEEKRGAILERVFDEESSEEGTEAVTTTDLTTDYYTSETDVELSSKQGSHTDNKHENEVIISNTNLSDTVRSFREPPIELDTINEDV